MSLPRTERQSASWGAQYLGLPEPLRDPLTTPFRGETLLLTHAECLGLREPSRGVNVSIKDVEDLYRCQHEKCCRNLDRRANATNDPLLGEKNSAEQWNKESPILGVAFTTLLYSCDEMFVEMNIIEERNIRRY